MIDKLKGSPLFMGMTESDIERCLKCSGAEVLTYEKEELLFLQSDAPCKLMILLEGAIAICNDSVSGKRSIVTTVNQAGELFGEVFLFLNKHAYDHYAQAVTSSRVLTMPREFFFRTCGKQCTYHAQLISNMLAILAQKAYYLNQKLQIMSCATLRQKITKVLLRNLSNDGRVTLSMNREELADFLNTARPSLSRELMKMQEDGLIQMKKKEILILQLDELQNLI
jgi:CRP-like cAMP-binding protein